MFFGGRPFPRINFFTREDAEKAEPEILLEEDRGNREGLFTAKHTKGAEKNSGENFGTQGLHPYQPEKGKDGVSPSLIKRIPTNPNFLTLR